MAHTMMLLRDYLANNGQDPLLPKLKALYPENDFIVYERDQPWWFTRMRVQHLEWVREQVPNMPILTLEDVAKDLHG